MVVAAAADEIEEHGLQLLGDGAAPAGADGAVVQLADGRHFGGGTREKRLIGDIHLIARDALFAHRDVQLPRQGYNRAARNAVQRGGEVRRIKHAIAYDEDILAAALGDIAFDIQQQRLVVAVARDFLQGEHGVHVVAVRLGLAPGDVDVMARKRRGLDAQPFFEVVLAQIRTPLPGGDHAVNAQTFRVQTHALGAVETHGTDIGRFELVLAHHRQLRGADHFFIERHGHAQDMRRVEQPGGVIGKPEDCRAATGLVRAHTLEYSHAVMQGMRQHMHLGFSPGHHLAVEPDQTVTIGHGHRQYSLNITARDSLALEPNPKRLGWIKPADPFDKHTQALRAYPPTAADLVRCAPASRYPAALNPPYRRSFTGK